MISEHAATGDSTSVNKTSHPERYDTIQTGNQYDTIRCKPATNAMRYDTMQTGNQCDAIRCKPATDTIRYDANPQPIRYDTMQTRNRHPSTTSTTTTGLFFNWYDSTFRFPTLHAILPTSPPIQTRRFKYVLHTYTTLQTG